MELPEYDTWYRVELFGDRGRWFAAPSPVDPRQSADFDTREDALAYARLRYPRQEWSQHRAPVRGQWRTRRMSGQS